MNGPTLQTPLSAESRTKQRRGVTSRPRSFAVNKWDERRKKYGSPFDVCVKMTSAGGPVREGAERETLSAFYLIQIRCAFFETVTQGPLGGAPPDRKRVECRKHL